MLQHYSASIYILEVQIMTCNSNQDCSGHGNCIQTCFCYPSYSGDTCSECKSDDYQMNKDGFCLQKCDSSCTARDFACLYDSDLKMNLCNCAITNSNPDENCNVCIDGYQGTKKDNCQPKECVNARKLCGDEGSCEKIDGKFACNCRRNYGGTYCETCKENMIKTFDGKCLPKECIDDKSEECSGHGNCDVANLECVCNHGYKNNLCQDCTGEFRKISDKYGTHCYPGNCFFEDEEYPCSENGTCVTEGTESYCSCQIDKSGEQCQNCGEEYEQLISGKCLPKTCAVNGLNCDDNGSCVFRNNAYQCSCLQNYDETTNCSSCIPGYTKIIDECVSDVCVINNTLCSNHGYCRLTDFANNISKCSCEEAYKGEFCDECSNDFILVDNGSCTKKECIFNNTECSTNGTCEEICLDSYCTIGWGCTCNNSFGPFCEKCHQDYVKTLSGHCVVEDCVADDQECGGHGVCSRVNFEHLCVCEENFTVESRCVECQNGYVLKENQCVLSIAGANKLSVGALAGICVGVLAVLVAVGVGIGVGVKKNKQRKEGSGVVVDEDQV